MVPYIKYYLYVIDCTCILHCKTGICPAPQYKPKLHILVGGGLSLGLKSSGALGTLPGATITSTLPSLGGLGGMAAMSSGGGLKLGGVVTTTSIAPTHQSKGLGGVDPATITGKGKSTGYVWPNLALSLHLALNLTYEYCTFLRVSAKFTSCLSNCWRTDSFCITIFISIVYTVSTARDHYAYMTLTTFCTGPSQCWTRRYLTSLASWWPITSDFSSPRKRQVMK